MFSKDGSETSSLNQWYLSGLTALVATAFALFSGGAIVGKLNAGKSVRIEVGQWAWLTQVRVDLERPLTSQTEALAQTDFVPNSASTIKTDHPSISESTVAPKVAARAIARKRSLVNKVKVRHADQVAVAAAAPSRLDVALDTQAESAEQKMQQLHSLLRKQFRLAVNSQFQADSMRVALAQSPSSLGQKKVTTQKAVAAKPLVAPVRRTQKQVALSSPAQKAPNHVALAGTVGSASKKTVLEEKLEEAARKVDSLVQMQKALVEAFDRMEGAQVQVASVSLKDGSKVAQPSDMPSIAAPSGPVSGVAFVGSSLAKSTGGKTVLGKIDYSALTLSARPNAGVNSQPESKKLSVSSHGYSLETDGQSEDSASQPAYPYIEAFSKNAPVTNVQVEAITMEEDGAGWKNYRAEGFWTTVARASSQSIPLLSENTAAMLAWAVGAKAQHSASIVFGKLPSGWTLSFSGRSEQGAFFNSENQPISAAEVDGVRQFVFTNAAPGAQMLIVRGRQPNEKGMVAIPVVAGRATYVDLTQVSFKSISGYVVDADEDELHPVPGAQVRLAGTSGEDVFSSASGRFEIQQVAVFNDYPLYLETDFSQGYTHRYEINRKNLHKVILYRVGDNRLSDWLGQLEGLERGVSPESSLLIATIPADLVKQRKNEGLFPQITPLMASPSLSPESYTILEHGQLEVEAPLVGENPKFLAVQIPEGPVTAELMNESKKVVWARLFMAQPRIINIVGQ